MSTNTMQTNLIQTVRSGGHAVNRPVYRGKQLGGAL